MAGIYELVGSGAAGAVISVLLTQGAPILYRWWHRNDTRQQVRDALATKGGDAIISRQDKRIVAYEKDRAARDLDYENRLIEANVLNVKCRREVHLERTEHQVTQTKLDRCTWENQAKVEEIARLTELLKINGQKKI